MHNFWRLTSLVLIIFLTTSPAIARQQIRIVGSTAVYTFITMVAERFGKTTDFKTPIVEATGTGGGIKIFCGGSGPNYPDIVNASRPMTVAEKRLCRQNGVKDLLELKIGYDGIVIGMDPSQDIFPLTRVDLAKALSEKVEIKGQWLSNPYKRWHQVNPSLPDEPIVVLGPTSTLATREVFEDMVIKQGCQNYVKDTKACSPNIREDGPFIEVAEHENVVLQKLALKPKGLGFVSFGFYHQNPNRLRPLSVDGVLPTVQTISDKSYPLTRPLYCYVKQSRLAEMPSLQAFLTELFSDQASGDYGYLVDKGLIPLAENERNEIKLGFIEHQKAAS